MIPSEIDSHTGADVTRLYRADHLQNVQNELFYRSTTRWEESASPQYFECSFLRAGSIRLAKVRKSGGGKLIVQRTWDDIRQDNNDYFSLIFLTKGELVLEHNNASCLADSSKLVTSTSNKPIVAEVLDNDDYAESYSLFVPTYEINRYLPHLDKLCGQAVSISDPAIAMAKDTCIKLFECGSHLPKHAVDAYIAASLQSLSAALAPDCQQRIEADSIKEVRFKGLLEYIDSHLSDAELTATLVASECGISKRYLYKLFKEKDMSFHDYLMGRRMQYARDWLLQDESRQQTIENIAYMSGFSSASHFGRVFKSKFGWTPTEARNIRD